MSILIIGFDSAWTAHKKGAMVALALNAEGHASLVMRPTAVSFEDAQAKIVELAPRYSRLLVMLDQPTIVVNNSGSRGVERIVASPVSRAKGGVQPANRGRHKMFGDGAPIWRFLQAIGGSLDPRASDTRFVIETYPALALLGLGWRTSAGSLPKYNPARRSYSASDWIGLCDRLHAAYAHRKVPELAAWCELAGSQASGLTRSRRKALQDQLDAVICLLVGLAWWSGEPTLQIGNTDSGLIVVPNTSNLQAEIEQRLIDMDFSASDWVCDITRQIA